MTAPRVTEWDSDWDRWFHRLMWCIKSTNDLALSSYCGDQIEDLKITLVCDADYAGDESESESSCRVLVRIASPTIYFPNITLSTSEGACLPVHARVKSWQWPSASARPLT